MPKRATRTEKPAAPVEEAPIEAAAGKYGWVTCVLLLIVVCAATFARAVGNDFVRWDDQIHVFENPYLERIDAANLSHLWCQPYQHLYIPISYTVFAAIAQLARMSHIDLSVTKVNTLLNPHVFHLCNVILHTLNALLVFAILRRLVGRDWPAAVGALLFAVHPLQVESVAWISELRGLLSGFFFLGAMVAYLYAVGPVRGSSDTPLPARERGKRGSPDGDMRLGITDDAAAPFTRPGYWVTVTLMVLALLSKPSAAALPFVLFIIDRWAVGRPLKACAVSTVPLLLIILPLCAVTQSVQPLPPIIIEPLWKRPFIAGDALAFYLAKLFVPWNLTIDYGRTPPKILASGIAYFTWVAPVLLGILIYLNRQRRPWLVAGALVSVAYLLPVLGFVPFIFQDHSTVADRYVYLAMLGPAVIVANLLANAGRPSELQAPPPPVSGRVSAKQVAARNEPGWVRSRVAAGYAVSGVVLVVLAVLSYVQIGWWKDTITLFGYAVAQNNDAPNMQSNYGLALFDSGHTDEAIAQYNIVIQRHPEYPLVWVNLGAAQLKEGDIFDAKDSLERASDLDPTNPQARRDLAGVLLQLGRTSEALDQLKQAVQLAPDDAGGYANYAEMLSNAGRNQEAADEFNRALQLNPTFLEAMYGLAVVDVGLGHPQDAVALCRRAVQIAPGDAAAHGALANALMSAGSTDEAVSEFQQAISDDSTQAPLYYGLGSALIKKGDAAGAVAALQQAASINSTALNHDALGTAYQAAGNLAAARIEYQSAHSLDPAFAPAIRHLASLK